MFVVRKIAPSPELRGVVKYFRVGEARLTGTPVRWPLPARADQFIEFYLADRYRVADYREGVVRTVEAAVVLGPHTRRKDDLVLQGTLLVFTIHFHPAGFHHLFGIPMRELANRALCAGAVLGREATDLHERLCEAADDASRVAAAEAFLRRRMDGRPPAGPAHRAALAIAAGRGRVDVASLARAACLSPRQLERRFLEEVGISPKTLSRLTRFEHMLDLRRERPDASWSRIAVEVGYYDQMHLVKEFHALAGESPSSFTGALRDAVPRGSPGLE